MRRVSLVKTILMEPLKKINDIRQIAGTILIFAQSGVIQC